MMERAVYTAAPIAEALDIPLVVWKEIHEEGGIFSRGTDKSNVTGFARQAAFVLCSKLPGAYPSRRIG